MPPTSFRPGLTAHQLARLLLSLPDSPVVYDWDGLPAVPLAAEVCAEPTDDDAAVPVVRLRGAFADRETDDARL